jgi:Alw26I/Eco31I/Esp3I family type II restriction m6 adenine DNA methyltransferase
LANSLLGERGRTEEGAAEVIDHALSALVDLLLDGLDRPPEPLFSWRVQDIPAEALTKLRSLTPEGIGALYEHLRGFKAQSERGGGLGLTRSALGRRNQGQFYTPRQIVAYIVSATLDALNIAAPEECGRVRVLDPAMGAGAFLTEALEQISARMMSGNSPLESESNPGRVKTAQLGLVRGAPSPAEVQSARSHALQKCLYGLDTDPVAVKIARAALLNRGGAAATSEFFRHVRQGNALIGEGPSAAGQSTDDLDRKHAEVYFKTRPLDHTQISRWGSNKSVLHWPAAFPEVFTGDRPGFDAIIGNPPYEILSAKESGIEDRPREQSYYRRLYKTCSGKINVYRLMLERGLALLRPGGALGFIVPATLLGDSTAESLREMILDEARPVQVVAIPEKARVFKGVTQALLILVIKQGESADAVTPRIWSGKGRLAEGAGVELTRELIRSVGSRIPILASEEEKAILQALTLPPRLGGDAAAAPVGRVHQGEVNLTVHRRFITDQPTALPLIRGEHVYPLRVVHPAVGRARLDWVLPAYLDREQGQDEGAARDKNRMERAGADRRRKGKPWQTERIVLGRVVNMGTARRLKAAAVGPGRFLGDMTNFITDLALPMNYLLGLLNSELLNWRIKVTSANNYLSAREVEDLPIPRITLVVGQGNDVIALPESLTELIGESFPTAAHSIERLKSALQGLPLSARASILATMIGFTAAELTDRASCSPDDVEASLWNLMNALVLMLYCVEDYSKVFCPVE